MNFRLVLASASPRRSDLLAAAGIAFDVDAVDVDERQQEGEAPEAYVVRVAADKAHAAAARHPGRVVLGADTIVLVDGEVLGKPANEDDAGRMLRLLSGRQHEVLTGVALERDGRRVSALTRTAVEFASLSADDIAWYVGTGEPFGKAGAYAIQGLGSRFIPSITGSYSNVVGLPVTLVVSLFQEMGFVPDFVHPGRVASGGESAVF